LSVDPDLAIWTWAVFLLLLLVLAKFAWKPIVAALDERENNIAKNIEDAARQNEDARQLLAEYDRRLAAAQDQVRAILDDARKSAEQSQQEILAKGRAEAEAEMNRAKREIETATSVALKELAERSTDLAIELAGKIVRKELSAKDHAQMIQEAVGRFPDAGPSRN
jgi:F-type H+-transporting ATPase subunit b